MTAIDTRAARAGLLATAATLLPCALVLCALVLCATAVPASAAPDGVEPMFDRSQVLGSVFCDVDGNGRHGVGELGVGGVRVAADTGDEVVTDTRGRWHLRRFDAGEHLLKVDETTLPPWATVVGSPRRRLAVSGGLEVRQDFALTCTLETVSPEPPAEDGDAAAIDPKALVTIAGTLEPPKLTVEARVLAVATAHLMIQPSGLDVPGTATNLQWAPGALLEPLVFLPAGSVAHAEKASWRLVITRVRKDGEVPVRELFGRGVAPERMLWDGTDAEGLLGILERGGLYRARLRVMDGFGGLAVSAAVTFGVSYGSSDTVLEQRLLRGELFDDAMVPKRGFWRGVRGLEKIVAGNPGSRLLIEVHSADDAPGDMALTQTRKAAFLLGEALAEKLKLDHARVLSLGFGSARPVAPNTNDTNRQLNRRVAITVLPPELLPLPPVPEPRFKPQVAVQGLSVELGKDLSFIASVKRPPGDRVAVDLTLPTGMRWQGLVDLAALPPLPKASAPDRDPHRFFGGPGLRRALGDDLIVDDSEPADTARILDVVLPAPDAVLQAPGLFVTGRTHPSNSVKVNGRVVVVEADGRFGAVVPLKVGKDRVEVVSTDGGGRTASVARETFVGDMQFFVLALADAGLGELDAHIDGRSGNTGGKVGPVFLHGRVAAYFKGRISGTALAEHLRITAHIDTAKRPGSESFAEQLIDPSRDYALFGDTASDTQGAPARGPVYVLVEADRSKLIAGDFRAGLEGLEILRYDRSLYGGLVHFEHAFAEGWDTTVRTFVSEDNSRLTRGHDELRATGGSLYYLSNHRVVEGSEQLTVVVREADTRFELGRKTLVRDRDYRIDHRDGRVMLTAPLSSWSSSVWDVSSFQPGTRRSVWGGHEVWLVADYEARVPDGGHAAGGVYAKQKLFDRVEVGAGYIHEARAGKDYQLWGGHVAADVWKGNRITAEIAGSRGSDGTTMLSHDGGLRFGLLDRSEGRDHGLALKVMVDSRPGEFFDDLDLDLRVRAWWQYAEVGFRSAGYAQDAGTERFGSEIVYRPTEDDDVRVRFDGTTLIEGGDDSFIGGVRSVRRLRWAARYQRLIGPLTLRAEAVYGQSRDDDDGKVQHSGGVVVGASWHVIEPLVLHLSQELLISNDEELVGRTAWSGLGTRIGADWRFTEALSLSFGHLFRWDGDHAFRVGVRSQIDDQTAVYLEERIVTGDRNGDLVGATVLGAEHRFDATGRAYGEYRIDGGIDGRSNRAIVGIGKRFDLAPGVSMSAGYERTESFGGFEGSLSRDVLSIGFQLLALERLKLSGRYELRVDVERSPGVDDPDPDAFVPRELVQAVALNSATLSITEDLTAMAVLNYTLTQDLASRRVERETLEGALSLVWRPQVFDWLTLAGRYGRYHTRFIQPGDTKATIETVDLISVGSHLNLPYRIQLTPKLAFRHRAVDGGEAHYELLWALRGGIDIYAGLDVAVEYRMLADFGVAVRHGALLEVGYTLFDHARLALGYDFNEIPRELTATGEAGRGGVYFRVTGRY